MVRGLLRAHRGGHAAVSNLELFFDLVYVFAITQISLFMRTHLGWAGLGEALLLFLAVWWAWIYTAWATNWADPDTVPVRLMLLSAMLASLVLAAVLPHAFDGGGEGRAHALAFALTYCLLQIGRTLFVGWAMATERPAGCRNMARIASWFAASAPLWIAGALAATRGGQVAFWGAALVIEYSGPFAFFRTPGLGRSTDDDWDISGGHMAERASQFVLIALGEAIVVTGSAFAEGAPGAARALAFLACFAGSAVMWWIYFDTGAKRGARHIVESGTAGLIARNAYTYLHMPIVASVIAAAVADALLMAAPQGRAEPALIAACGGGMMVYLLGLALFKRASSPLGNMPLSHGVGFVLIAALVVAAAFGDWSAIGFTALCDGALLLVAVWEWGSLHGGWRERFAR